MEEVLEKLLEELHETCPTCGGEKEVSNREGEVRECENCKGKGKILSYYGDMLVVALREEI